MIELSNRAGINLLKNKLQLVELVFRNKEYYLNYVDEAYFNDEINYLHDKETKISESIQEALDEILSRHELASNSISFALPLEVITVLKLPVDSSLLTQDQLEEFKWEFSVLYPESSTDAYIYQFYEIKQSIGTDRAEALVVRLPRNLIKLLRSLSDKNGLLFSYADFSHFASDCAIRLNYPQLSEVIVLSLYYSGSYISIELLKNNKPVYITKHSVQNVNEIIKIIEQEFLTLSSITYSKGDIQNVFLSGEAITPGLMNGLKDQLQIKINHINPFKVLPINPKLSESKLLREKFHTFSAAAGIAYRLH